MATTRTSSKSSTQYSEQSKSQSKSESKSLQTTKNILDTALRDEILSGLMGYMTDEEIAAYAENLLNPQLKAGIEAAQQGYETTELAKRQEIENLASALARSVEQQNMAYRQNMADVQNAALARGMGRSSYTLQSLANQGNALAQAVMQLMVLGNDERIQLVALFDNLGKGSSGAALQCLNLMTGVDETMGLNL